MTGHGPHTPTRFCVGCGQRAAQADLLRFVAGPAGLALDRHRCAAGRGAYLHPDEQCWKGFAARKAPLRSLRRSIDRAQRMAFVQQLRDAQTR